jgi:hypothetical protein
MRTLKNQIEQHMDHQFSAQGIRVAGYQEASPFAHTVIERFLPDEVIAQVIREFPEEPLPAWSCEWRGQ